MKQELDCQKELSKKFEDMSFNYTLSLISGKYKLIILHILSSHGIVRYNEMKRLVGSVSHKTLSSTLKEMEKDNLITRKEYPQIPPKVEYSLSKKGESLIPILKAVCKWGHEHRE